MALLRFGSEFPIPTLQRELERFFHNPAFTQGLSGHGTYPPLNVFENKEGVVIVAEVAGLDPSQIHIAGHGRTLNISGERKARETGNPVGFHRRERSFGAFSRSLQLADDYDMDRAEAKYQNGVLVVRVPKAESAKPRQITVQAG
ncbi:MAG TPA: Hsp20/alpha crystallin family protein [Candidatus Binataceae bacterium]|jgi:HSP20 family protein|nr:Hsp20/alpha crystallin family protein [Candidatus Binataceae bacterium]